MKYPINLIEEGGGFTITFPDIPEAITEVHCKDDIDAYALDCFKSALEFYSEDKRAIPQASDNGDYFVTIPLTLMAKIYLFNAWLDSKMTKSELAVKTGIKQPNIQRLFDFKYSPKIDTIEQVLTALGKDINISVS